MKKVWKLEGDRLVLKAEDGFVEQTVPFCEAEVVFVLNAKDKLISSLMKEIEELEQQARKGGVS
jgi:transcription initiation factor IIE alpha subunit